MFKNDNSNFKAMNKPYDSSLSHYDIFGRKVVKEYITKNTNLTVIDNPDIYGVDLLFYKKENLVAYGEVEVRSSWKSKKFPFQNLNVPFRKDKFFAFEIPTYFFSVNQNGTAMFICLGEVIKKCKIENSPNKYLKYESFFKVPLKYLQFIDLDI